MESNKIYQGNCLEQLNKIDDNSIQCVVTSPPYWGLRDYGVKGQIGLEPMPEDYVNNLIKVFSEVKRVLRQDGTIWLNLGDSYYGSGRGHNCEQSRGKYTEGQYASASSALNIVDKTAKHKFLKPKDLCGIPFRVAFALQERLGLYLRQAIIWHKPNAMPSSVSDRPTTDYEFIFLLSKSDRYYYDADSIREPHKLDSVKRACRARTSNKLKAKNYAISYLGENVGYDNMEEKLKNGELRSVNKGGRNNRAVWSITLKPYSGAHFATFPPELPRRCILAGSKEGDIILDPFAGAGTTLMAAKYLGRKYIGIELSKEYITLINKRIAQETITDFFYTQNSTEFCPVTQESLISVKRDSADSPNSPHDSSAIKEEANFS